MPELQNRQSPPAAARTAATSDTDTSPPPGPTSDHRPPPDGPAVALIVRPGMKVGVMNIYDGAECPATIVEVHPRGVFVMVETRDEGSQLFGYSWDRVLFKHDEPEVIAGDWRPTGPPALEPTGDVGELVEEATEDLADGWENRRFDAGERNFVKTLPRGGQCATARLGDVVTCAALDGDAGVIVVMLEDACVVRSERGAVVAARWADVAIEHCRPDPAQIAREVGEGA